MATARASRTAGRASWPDGASWTAGGASSCVVGRSLHGIHHGRCRWGWNDYRSGANLTRTNAPHPGRALSAEGQTRSGVAGEADPDGCGDPWCPGPGPDSGSCALPHPVMCFRRHVMRASCTTPRWPRGPPRTESSQGPEGPACDVTQDPMCDGRGYQNYTVEVVDRMGTDSFTPDSGVLLAKTKNQTRHRSSGSSTRTRRTSA